MVGVVTRFVIAMVLVGTFNKRGCVGSQFSGPGIKHELVDLVWGGVRHENVVATGIQFDAVSRSFRLDLSEQLGRTHAVLDAIHRDVTGTVVGGQQARAGSVHLDVGGA